MFRYTFILLGGTKKCNTFSLEKELEREEMKMFKIMTALAVILITAAIFFYLYLFKGEEEVMRIHQETPAFFENEKMPDHVLNSCEKRGGLVFIFATEDDLFSSRYKKAISALEEDYTNSGFTVHYIDPEQVALFRESFPLKHDEKEEEALLMGAIPVNNPQIYVLQEQKNDLRLCFKGSIFDHNEALQEKTFKGENSFAGNQSHRSSKTVHDL